MKEGLKSLTKAVSPIYGSQRIDRPIPFIEHKRVDFVKLQESLEISERQNHWANFGPVSRLLETAIEQHLHLPSCRSVVLCSSATAALFAMVAAKEYRAGRPLRWVTSAYGFYSSWLGPLSGAKILDCNGQGMLELEALDALPPVSFDGVLITNVFGVAPDLGKYIELCRLKRKHLIVDNAVVLEGFPRQNPQSSVDEIISFHQTKPWGMGEGGCAIVDSDEAVVLRAMTNFGVGLAESSARGASNSKISDFSCALILNRMRTSSEWQPLYRAQARRIFRLAQDAGLSMLAPMDLESLTPPHLPLLNRSSLSYDSLINEKFVMRKYYLPHTGDYPKAQQIYSHIVNIPCHPGMAELSDSEILDSIRQVAYHQDAMSAR